MMSDLHQLPDGSGFFTGSVGPRYSGFFNFCKYHSKGNARGWLLFWRNFRMAYTWSRKPEMKMKPLSLLEAFCWAWSVQP
jgi:hypothetical protein